MVVYVKVGLVGHEFQIYNVGIPTCPPTENYKSNHIFLEDKY